MMKDYFTLLEYSKKLFNVNSDFNFYSSDSIKGRYSDLLEDMLSEKGYEIIAAYGEDDYQGSVYVVAFDEDSDNILLYDYTYGSCGGCDDWDERDLSDNNIKEEMFWNSIIVSPDEAIKILKMRLGKKERQ